VDYTDQPLSTVAFNAGLDNANSYIGRAYVFDNDNYLPGRIVANYNTSIDSKYCFYYGDENCITKFQYLDDSANQTFQWILSQNGEYVPSAVIFNDYYIGRVNYYNRNLLGVVDTGYGLSYYDDQTRQWHFINSTYQVLTCNSVENPPEVYDCCKYRISGFEPRIII
jgi:Protein of unknown function (DUF3421)